MLAKLHLAEDTFPLQLLLQRSQSLVDVVIANKYLHEAFPFSSEMFRQNSNPPVYYDMTPALQVDQFISPISRHMYSGT